MGSAVQASSKGSKLPAKGRSPVSYTAAHQNSSFLEYQDLLVGFVRMHILHHAAESDIYGQWMIDELARHGYKMSAGTLYPMLHGMEERGYLKSHEKRSGRTYRRFYRATPLGRKALALVRTRLSELFNEVGKKQRKRLNGAADRA
jgi:DNA-binding PadR family transcriptional regulator